MNLEEAYLPQHYQKDYEKIQQELFDPHKLDNYSMSSNETTTHLSPPSTSFTIIIIKSLIYTTLMVWTILGNFLVCLALCIDKRLKCGGISNYLIGNLAVWDLLLGLTVLPFSILNELYDYWFMGRFFCYYWLIIDVLCCSASIWGLCIIAFDRYRATNQPINYNQNKFSIKLALRQIIIGWIISIIICIPGIITVVTSEPYHQRNITESIGTSQNFSFNLHYLNDGSNWEINQSHKQRRHTNVMNMMNNDQMDIIKNDCILFTQTYFVLLSSFLSFYLPSTIMVILYIFVYYSLKKRQMHRFETEELRKKKHHEKRITKNLLIVMICFIVCWLPFFVTYPIRSLCEACVHVDLMNAFIWLGYSNSALNPLLYTILNPNFRQAFKNIISCYTSANGSRLNSHSTSTHNHHLPHIAHLKNNNKDNS